MLPAEPPGGRQQALIPVAGQGVSNTSRSDTILLCQPPHLSTTSQSCPEHLALPSSVVSLQAPPSKGRWFPFASLSSGGFASSVMLGWKRPMAWHVGDRVAPHRDCGMACGGWLTHPAALVGDAAVRRAQGIRGAQTGPSMHNGISDNIQDRCWPL